ncbi:choice-of-anchor D domain-containing protein [Undibacterium sp. 14-3-2]|uniref:choice-of-anchor D domain-containing protein n=1 Tax=Undibacterium sp. 14-3-2 TaxID=2800129 RepID=UPI001F21EFA6|nr:choice-of-anchor D domain-containing protein [Undibacterium sp. 14-3-2]
MKKIRPPHRHALYAAGMWAFFVLTPAAQAADALNGKSLYLNGPASGGTSCASCHSASPANNVSGILAAANNPSVISGAIAANRGGMGSLYNGKFNATEIADLAAFIGNPNVTASAVASLAPASLSFAGTTVGQNSSALSTTLTNSGNATLNISTISVGGSHASDFVINGGSCSAGSALAAGAACQVQLVFRPAAAGARNGTLTISHNATGGSSSIPLSGTGNAVPTATVAISANSLNFGSLLTGSTSPAQTITVNNAGQATLNFSAITLSGTNATTFRLGGTCATSTPVAAGGSCTVTVTANPAVAGAFSANLNLASNASNNNVTVSLAGSASAAAPSLAANPGAVSFGAQTIGAAATTQNISISNQGNVPVNFSSIAVSGAPAVSIGSGGCAGTLAVATSCNVPLLFAPTAAGNISATLLIRSNAPDLSVSISGSGTTAAVARPVLSDTAAIAFADTQVGQQTSAHRTTLSNNGNAALKITSLVIGGSHTGDFALAGSCVTGATVSPGGNCSIDSSFKPTATGIRNADLLLVTDSGAQFSVHLSGNGIAVPTTTPSLTSNPQSFDFGKATIGSQGVLKRFTLTNTGSAALTLNSASFSGPFAIVSDSNACASFPLTLAAGASCDLPVSFRPSTAGSISGSLQLQASNGNWTIALSGQGETAAPVNNTGAQSQNRGGGGCSVAQDGNDPMLAVLVVLAAGVLVWRRRRASAATTATAATIATTLAGVATCAVLALPAPASALETGKPAPAFTLNGPDGSVRLDQYQGKLIYVDFWASWCGPCRQSFPWMNEMQARYGNQGLQIIGINVDAKVDDARNFLASTPARFVIAFDPSGTAPRTYGIKGMPSSVLIGQDGKVLYEHSGFRAADREQLESRIKTALGVAK